MKRRLIAAALCAMPLLSVADTSAKPMQLKGYISDSKCAATHNAGKPDAKCVQKCIKDGNEKPVFVDAKNEVWSIDNPDAVTQASGNKVTVEATPDQSNKTMHIIRLISNTPVKGSSGMMD